MFLFAFQEFMKATVDLADLLGLHLVMSRNAGKGEYKIMVAAMGWATAELVMSRLALTSHFIKMCYTSTQQGLIMHVRSHDQAL